MPRNDAILFRKGTAAPVASDFLVAEPAWDATAGVLYLKRTDGTFLRIGPFTAGSGIAISSGGVISATGGGGSISDGAKGDITVSNSGATWTINAGAVVTADLADSAVTSVKIAAGAVSGDKLTIHPFLLMGA